MTAAARDEPDGAHERSAEPAGSVTVRVPAKVNLHLSVGRRRDDGYHQLHTVYQAISLYDEIRAEPADRLDAVVTGTDAEALPTDENNLAVAAAALLADRLDRPPHVRLHIHKRIPLAGGLAGGSADAAGALLACHTLWGGGLRRDELAELAAHLGSDVPFLLAGGTALGTGRGEIVNPVLATGTWHWVVAVASGGLSTPRVYAELDRLRQTGAVPPDSAGPPDELLAALRQHDPRVLAAALANDMQPAAIALRPALRRTLSAGTEEGALAALVSGSGPSCLFLAPDADTAARIAGRLSSRGVCRTLRVTRGPVGV